MASIEELEKKVEELQKQLKTESERTLLMEKEVKDLSQEVSSLREDTTPLSSPKTTKTKVIEPAMENGTKKKDTKDEESSSSSDEGQQVSNDVQKTATIPQNASGGIIKEGFLEKKGAIRHNWRKRWFELDSTQKFLCYYVKKGDTQAKGVIPLTNATCYAHVEKKGSVKPLFFNIRTETRDFLIRAESPEEKVEWVKLIKTQCIKGQLSPEGKKHLAKKASSFIGRTTEDPKK